MTAAEPALLIPRYEPWIVVLSVLIAAMASYVALDLAKRVRTPDRAIAVGWWAGGSLAMGTGIWSMHFIGMLALELPIAIGYRHGVTFLSWAAGVAVSGIALRIAGGARLTSRGLARGAFFMAAGICAMHYTGMLAIDIAPGIVWDWSLVALSALIAAAASAVALLIFFWLRRHSGWRAIAWQVAAALVMGLAISGMHYTGMAAAGFVEGAVCASAGQLSGDELGTLVATLALVMLALTTCTSILDSRLQRLAFHDVLTGLPNRHLFEERLAAAADRCERDGHGLAVLFIDLDGFKPINDSFGHPVGDEVLRCVAQRLRGVMRVGDLLSRSGGDEFLLLSEGVASAEDARRLAQRLLDALLAPFAVAGRQLGLSCSIGIARLPDDGPREKLISHADAAMYAAKRLGGGRLAFFTGRMEVDTREQVELQQALRLALEPGELELFYQPKVDAASGRLTGAEALVRWRHPARGLLAPGVFIPLAERFGLIGALGHWVIGEACRQLRAWLDTGLTLRVSVNLSMQQLREDGLVGELRAALARHAIDPRLLTLEITESAAMEDAETTLRILRLLAGVGVALSIDDFGTGYSSLAYLRQLPARELKIDRSFVADLEGSADARAVVDAVVRLAHALAFRVVAEGVETRAQRDILLGLQCDEMQGWLFARPMPAAALPGWLAERERRAAAAEAS